MYATERNRISHDGDSSIAIVGVSCYFPKSENKEVFWKNLVQGRDLISEVPENRVEVRQAETENGVKFCGGFSDEMDKFDYNFFGINRREAECMDPQQRISLQIVWKAIEDAGYKASDLSRQKTGVFFAVMNYDYGQILLLESAKLDPYMLQGNSNSMVSNRISYIMNFKGPSLTIDSACSSSLVALHYAIVSIKSGLCDTAIVGSVNALLSPMPFLSLSMAGLIKDDGNGRCRTLDKSADGYTRGEGGGAIIIKALDKAIDDGDFVYAVIKGSSVNHGGKTKTLLSPNPLSQSTLLFDTYANAGITPDTVSYIELHGTGTPLGDPIECHALLRAFRKLEKHFNTDEQKGYCGLGSVKTNIGHLEPASGIAGLIKVLLSMQYKTLPASIHFSELNPKIKLKDSPFFVVDSLRPWSRITGSDGTPVPRRAGVSSFGFGGTNAHVILEEFPEQNVISVNPSREKVIFCLSAKNPERLRQYLSDWLEFLKNMSEVSSGANNNLHDYAYTLQVGREAMESRFSCVVESFDELKLEIKRSLDTESDRFTLSGDQEGASSQLSIDRDGISNLMERREYDALADVWMHGADFDWHQLYSMKRMRRASLPTYPFAKTVLPISIFATKGKPKEKGMDEKMENTVRIRNDETLVQDSMRCEQAAVKSPDALREMYQCYFKKIVADTLRVSISKIDTSAYLINYGIDSLNIVSIMKKLQKTFGDEISSEILFKYQTIDALVTYFVHAYPDTVIHHSEISVSNENLVE